MYKRTWNIVGRHYDARDERLYLTIQFGTEQRIIAVSHSVWYDESRKTIDLAVSRGTVDVTDLETKARKWDELQALSKEYYALPMSAGGAAQARSQAKKKAVF